jgi:hypothetical protein
LNAGALLNLLGAAVTPCRDQSCPVPGRPKAGQAVLEEGFSYLLASAVGLILCPPAGCDVGAPAFPQVASGETDSPGDEAGGHGGAGSGFPDALAHFGKRPVLTEGNALAVAIEAGGEFPSRTVRHWDCSRGSIAKLDTAAGRFSGTALPVENWVPPQGGDAKFVLPDPEAGKLSRTSLPEVLPRVGGTETDDAVSPGPRGYVVPTRGQRSVLGVTIGTLSLDVREPDLPDIRATHRGRPLVGTRTGFNRTGGPRSIATPRTGRVFLPGSGPAASREDMPPEIPGRSASAARPSSFAEEAAHDTAMDLRNKGITVGARNSMPDTEPAVFRGGTEKRPSRTPAPDPKLSSRAGEVADDSAPDRLSTGIPAAHDRSGSAPRPAFSRGHAFSRSQGASSLRARHTIVPAEGMDIGGPKTSGPVAVSRASMPDTKPATVYSARLSREMPQMPVTDMEPSPHPGEVRGGEPTVNSVKARTGPSPSAPDAGTSVASEDAPVRDFPKVAVTDTGSSTETAEVPRAHSKSGGARVHAATVDSKPDTGTSILPEDTQTRGLPKVAVTDTGSSTETPEVPRAHSESGEARVRAATVGSKPDPGTSVVPEDAPVRELPQAAGTVSVSSIETHEISGERPAPWGAKTHATTVGSEPDAMASVVPEEAPAQDLPKVAVTDTGSPNQADKVPGEHPESGNMKTHTGMVHSSTGTETGTSVVSEDAPVRDFPKVAVTDTGSSTETAEVPRAHSNSGEARVHATTVDSKPDTGTSILPEDTPVRGLPKAPVTDAGSSSGETVSAPRGGVGPRSHGTPTPGGGSTAGDSGSGYPDSEALGSLWAQDSVRQGKSSPENMDSPYPVIAGVARDRDAVPGATRVQITGADTDNVFASVIERVRASDLDRGRARFEIDMGEGTTLRVRLSVDRNVVNARIDVPDEQVRDLLAANAWQLHERLHNEGLVPSNIQFCLAGGKQETAGYGRHRDAGSGLTNKAVGEDLGNLTMVDTETYAFDSWA